MDDACVPFVSSGRKRPHSRGTSSLVEFTVREKGSKLLNDIIIPSAGGNLHGRVRPQYYLVSTYFPYGGRIRIQTQPNSSAVSTRRVACYLLATTA